MSRLSVPTRRAVALLCVALAVYVARAGAVVGGQEDTNNRFANVGNWQLQLDDEWFGFCTGTLVTENVVLTAAHCMDFFGVDGGLPVEDLRITFDPTPDAGSTYYGVDHIVIHPEWANRPILRGNSKRLGLAPPAEDIALVWLAEDVTGIDPAPLPDSVGYLDTLALTMETFTVVGYGLQGFVTGNIVSPAGVAFDSGNRNYRDVTVISEHEAFADRFVKITASTCFGDSGGPLFHGETQVAVNTWTSSARCVGPSYSYRLDSPTAQAFLNLYL